MNLKIRSSKTLNNNIIYDNMENAKLYLSCFEDINTLNVNIPNKNAYIIGGGQIYKELLPFCERVYLTKILHAYDDVDTYFPNIDNMLEWERTSASEVKEYNGIRYQFCVYDRAMCEE